MPDPIYLREHSRRMFRERMRRGDLRACILPIAAIEQHLEHLAMEHDWRSVSLVAAGVAERLSPQVIVAEGVMAGISEHHMVHHGTLTLRPGTFLAVLNDLIRSLKLAGFDNILVLNGHGGNVAPCTAIWDQYLREFQINLQFMSYWDVLTQQDADELLHNDSRMLNDLPGHAQEFETSIAMAFFPENISSEAMADQPDTSPQSATSDQGREFYRRIVERVSHRLEAMISGDRRVSVPPFHP